MPRSSSTQGGGSGKRDEPKNPKEPLVVTGDSCSSCGRLKTDQPVEGNCREETCTNCGGTGLSVSAPNCPGCGGDGIIVVRYGGCKKQEQHYCTRP